MPPLALMDAPNPEKAVLMVTLSRLSFMNQFHEEGLGITANKEH